ncbi:MAG: ATP-binding protein, partial [Gammaproteobacteria bacterium]|nr:ATP-binding protein [Gammaproteobacteria bacterium]
QTIKAEQRPIVIITSNNEKELPDAFLRRCFFHYIRFPDKEALAQIVDVHLPHLRRDLLSEALELFFGLREMSQLKKKPSTSELIDWLKLLLAEQIPAETLAQSKQQGGLMPLYGALLKNEQDVALVEKLLFMAKRQGR